MNFTIYSVGDGAFLRSVLDSSALVFNSSEITGIVATGMLLGFLTIAFSAISKQQMPLQTMLVVWIVYSVMFSNTSNTVYIEDMNTGVVHQVDNIPLGVGFVGELISTAGFKITELMEQAYSWPGITNGGYMNTLEVILGARDIGAGPANSVGGVGNVERTIINYISDCTLVGVDMGFIDMNTIYSSQDTLAAIYFPSDIYSTQSYLPTDPAGGAYKTCSDAYPEMTAYVNGDFRTNWGGYLNAKLGIDTAGDPTATGGDIDNALNAIVGSSTPAYTYMVNNFMTTLMYKAQQKDYLTYGDTASALIVEEAVSKRNVQYAAEQSLFVRTMRPMMTFMESLIYAITPLMGMIMMFGEIGMRLVGKWVLMLIWVTLWKPIMAVTNLYVQMSVNEKMGALQSTGYDSISQSGLVSLHAETADWIATGGMLAASTPVLTLFLITGSMMAANSVATRMQGRDTIDENKASPNVTNMGAGVNMDARYSNNPTTGTLMGGSSGTLDTVSMGSALNSSSASRQAYAESKTAGLQSSVSQIFGVSGSNSYTTTEGQQAMQSVVASNSQLTQARDSMVANYKNENSHKNEDVETLKLAGNLAISGRSQGLSGDQLQSYISKGLSASGDASLANDAQTRQTQSESIARSFARSAEKNETIGSEFRKQLNSDITKGNTSSWEKKLTESEQKSYQDNYSEAQQATQMYENANTLSSNFGVGFTGKVNEMAAKVLNNTNGEGTGLAKDFQNSRYSADFQRNMDQLESSGAYGPSGDPIKDQKMLEESAAIKTMAGLMGKNDSQSMEFLEGKMGRFAEAMGLSQAGQNPSAHNANQGLQDNNPTLTNTVGNTADQARGTITGADQNRNRVAGELSTVPQQQGDLYQTGASNTESAYQGNLSKVDGESAQQFKNFAQMYGMGDTLAGAAKNGWDTMVANLSNDKQGIALSASSMALAADGFFSALKSGASVSEAIEQGQNRYNENMERGTEDKVERLRSHIDNAFGSGSDKAQLYGDFLEASVRNSDKWDSDAENDLRLLAMDERFSDIPKDHREIMMTSAVDSREAREMYNQSEGRLMAMANDRENAVQHQSIDNYSGEAYDRFAESINNAYKTPYLIAEGVKSGGEEIGGPAGKAAHDLINKK